MAELLSTLLPMLGTGMLDLTCAREAPFEVFAVVVAAAKLIASLAIDCVDNGSSVDVQPKELSRESDTCSLGDLARDAEPTAAECIHVS